MISNIACFSHSDAMSSQVLRVVLPHPRPRLRALAVLNALEGVLLGAESTQKRAPEFTLMLSPPPAKRTCNAPSSDTPTSKYSESGDGLSRSQSACGLWRMMGRARSSSDKLLSLEASSVLQKAEEPVATTSPAKSAPSPGGLWPCDFVM